MATKIDYLDETWNPVAGCTKCSPGCDNCYAEKMMYRQVCMGCARHEKNPDSNEDAWIAYSGVMDEDTHKWNGEVSLRYDQLDKPLHWRRPRRIGVQFMGDLFHPKVPFEFIDKVFAIMAICPQHTFIVLTKRDGRMLHYTQEFIMGQRHLGDALRYMGIDGFANRLLIMTAYGALKKSKQPPYKPFPNVTGMVTVCNQDEADDKIPNLLQCPFAKRGVSLEPLLGEIDISEFLIGDICGGCGAEASEICVHQGQHWVSGPEPNLDEPCGPIIKGGGIDWVVVGCESGPKRRECKLEWIRDIVRQCKAAGVPCFVKQIPINGKVSHNPDEWPEDLRCRQWLKMKEIVK